MMTKTITTGLLKQMKTTQKRLYATARDHIMITHSIRVRPGAPVRVRWDKLAKTFVISGLKDEFDPPRWYSSLGFPRTKEEVLELCDGVTLEDLDALVND
jgi:hypothetical protein